ncbi:pyridoxamine 5'-phosphate oxidase [Bacillus coreaensis]
MTVSADKLTADLISSLQGETMVSLITMNAETNLPQLSVVSWVHPVADGKRIKVALGYKASSIENIRSNSNVVLGVIGAGSCYSVQGKASVSEIKELTMKLYVVTIEVETVENVMFYGGKITTEPAYEKTYNKDLAIKLDTEVYELLRE